ncbi:MAG: hypothetical protein QNK03_24265 [Myxococcota bacterium]|nr:hypothetical protein [Myxococcota bacterium]
MSYALSREDILRLLRALNTELEADGVRGQVNLAGGAVMCLAFGARASTRDVDAVFEPSVAVLDAALRVAAREGVRDTWLNDAVKGYVSDRGTFVPFLELSHLKVFRATGEYMLAMKCLAMRIGEGYRDEEDVRYLVRNLGIGRYDEALEVLGRYYALPEYPETALLALRELLPDPASRP